MIFPDHPLWLLQKNARLLGMFHFLSPLSLRMASLNRGVQIFSSKKPTKFVPFRQILQRCQTKNEPFGLHFEKSTNKNLRVRIPVTFGGADKKWNVPYMHHSWLLAGSGRLFSGSGIWPKEYCRIREKTNFFDEVRDLTLTREVGFAKLLAWDPQTQF